MTIIYVDDCHINIVRFEKELKALQGDFHLHLFEDADAALDFCKQQKPDIAFLDIEMEEHDGIWLANELNALSIPFAFVTSYLDYAVKAFEVSALHYIVKPVSAQSIKDTIDRLEKTRTSAPLEAIKEHIELLQDKERPTDYPKKIFVRNRFKIMILNLSEVLYFEASGSYTLVKTQGGASHLSSKLLQSYNDLLLHHPDFIRIQRSYLVNKNFIQSIHKNKRKNMVELSDGTQLEISTAMSKDIYNLL